MAKMNAKQVKNLIYYFYFYRGKFPPGTTYQTFESLKMGDLQVDDPPLPGEPHFEKKKLALELQHQFFQLGFQLTSPLAEMKKKTQTTKVFHQWCHANHKEFNHV
jgi:hypothetical protein